MKKLILFFLPVFCFLNVYSQINNNESLSVLLEELSSPEFFRAVEKSNGTCIIPLGILEKHGPHMPLSADLIQAREISVRAAQKEYVLVFPEYYFGQIYEAQHQPGTFAYSPELIWKLLQETCDELSRNGIKKIVLVNGHGGNTNFLNYFCQAQLAEKRDYAVVLFQPDREAIQKQIDTLMTSTFDYHAGETETSVVYSIRPELVDTAAAHSQSGNDMARLDSMPYAYTGIWWYSRFPNHYAGDGSIVNPAIGKIRIEESVKQLIELLKYIKSDNTIIELQNEFFEKAQNPMEN